MTLLPSRCLSLSLALFALVALAGCNEPSPNVEAAKPAASPEATPEAAAPVETRVVEITADSSGYSPKEIPAKVGETLTLRFTRKTESECLAQIAVPSQKIKKDLPIDTPVDVIVKAEAPGEIPFRCGMAMLFGKIVVSGS